jgi:Protein of unknown function (DUF3071)
MQELRFVAVSEDGRYAVLAVPGRSARFTLPIDERLRAVALGQTSRLVQYEIEVESPLRPKEIQARIRAGETVEEIADAAGIAVERVRWFEGPVLAERAYVADQAKVASVRRQGDATPSTPGPRLGEIVAERLKALGSDPEDAQWDAKKRGDGSWQVQLTFISGGRLHEADWIFDPRRRHVLPADDNAARMSLPGGEAPQPAAPPPGEATVTRLAPRLSAVSGQGFSPSGSTAGFGPAGLGNGAFGSGGPGNGGPGNGAAGNGGRARHERSGSGRPAVSEPAASAPSTSAAPPEPADSERDDYPAAPEQQVAAAQVPETPPAPEAPVAPAPAAVAPFTARNAPVIPATVAAQVSQPAQAARSETSAGETVASATAPVASAAAPAEGSNLAPAASAEPASEQAGRQGRKSARGKRSSVPSWDEIMFGSSRQRD